MKELILNRLVFLVLLGALSFGVATRGAFAQSHSEDSLKSAPDFYCLSDDSFLQKVDQLELFLRSSLEDILWHPFELDRTDSLEARSVVFSIFYHEKDSKLSDEDKKKHNRAPFNSRNLNALRQILSDRLVQFQKKSCSKEELNWKKTPTAQISIRTTLREHMRF